MVVRQLLSEGFRNRRGEKLETPTERARVVLITLSVLMLIPAAVAQTAPLGPNNPQRNLFESNLNKLQNVTLPTEVNEIVGTLSQPLEMSFSCAQGSPVERVSISITTTLRAWNPALQNQAGDRAGVYLWNGRVQTGPQEKMMTFDNTLAFDPSFFTQAQSPLQALTDETLVYHELLHGQLLVNAMKTSSWRENVCACNGPNLAPSDSDHTEIPGLEQTLAEQIAADEPSLFALNIAPQNGQSFSKTLGAADSLLGGGRAFRATFHTSTGSNVQVNSLQVGLENDEVIVRGQLDNPAEAGFVVVQLQPD